MTERELLLHLATLYRLAVKAPFEWSPGNSGDYSLDAVRQSMTPYAVATREPMVNMAVVLEQRASCV